MAGQASKPDSVAIWMLAFAETFGWASLFYIYGALLVWIEADTGWDRTAMALGLTLALLVSAVSVSFAGRLVDRGLGAELMVGGAGLGGLALIGLSQVTTLTGWYVAWAFIGLAMAASFYDMCFAFLTRRLGTQARPAIIRVTLVAGFASTIAFPLGAVFAQTFGWRGAVMAFAGLQLFVAVPLFYFAGRRLRKSELPGVAQVIRRKGAVKQALRKPGFWLLAGAFGLSSMNHAMLVTYFIPIFTGLGATSALAVAAASIVGPFQVIGRAALLIQGQKFGSLTSTKAAFFGLALSSSVLLMAGGAPLLVFVFAAIQGSAVGLTSILRPVLIAEVLGQQDFGSVSGAIATVPLLANAVAPLVGALLIGAGGVTAILLAALGLGLAALGLSLLMRVTAENTDRT